VLTKQMMAPLKAVDETLESAVMASEDLINLPNTVRSLKVDSCDDLAKVNTAPMKSCLDTRGLTVPLVQLTDLKSLINVVVEAIKAGIGALEEFVSMAPGTIRSAFDVPPPLCFCTATVPNQLPQVAKDMLAGVARLAMLDLQPIVVCFEVIYNVLAAIDVMEVQASAEKFAIAAEASVDELDKEVQMATMRNQTCVTPICPVNYAPSNIQVIASC